MPMESTLRIAAYGLLAIATSATAGCSGSSKVDPEAFAWSGALAAPGVIRLRDTNGSIDVKPATDGNVRITAETRWRRGNPKRDINFVVASNGNDVTVCAVWGSGTCTATEYKSGSHSLLRSLFRGGTTDATVKFTVFVPTGVKVDASTTNGGVTVLATAPVQAHTINGTVKVGTSVGPVEASTMNGNVDARMTTLGGDGPVKVTTMNGTASAYLPEAFDGAVHVSTMNGRVGSDYAVTVTGGESSKNSVEGSIGAGGRVVEVTSMNGSAWLRKLNADGTVAGTTASTPAAKP